PMYRLDPTSAQLGPNAIGPSRSRQRVEDDGYNYFDESNVEVPVVFSSNGKAKAKVKEPAYEGKGKGKAPVVQEPEEEGEGEGTTHLSTPATKAGKSALAAYEARKRRLT
ncbi:hypothetical protein PtrSN002B_009196, partial [Pyrenophora tritici-repentis]